MLERLFFYQCEEPRLAYRSQQGKKKTSMPYQAYGDILRTLVESYYDTLPQKHNRYAEFYEDLSKAWENKWKQLQNRANMLDWQAAMAEGRLPSAASYRAILACVEDFYRNSAELNLTPRNKKSYLNRIALTYRLGDVASFWEYVSAFRHSIGQSILTTDALKPFEKMEEDASFHALLETYAKQQERPPLPLPRIISSGGKLADYRNGYIGMVYQGSTLPPCVLHETIAEVLSKRVENSSYGKPAPSIDSLNDAYDKARTTCAKKIHTSLSATLSSKDPTPDLEEYFSRTKKASRISREWVADAGIDRVATEAWLTCQLEESRATLAQLGQSFWKWTDQKSYSPSAISEAIETQTNGALILKYPYTKTLFSRTKNTHSTDRLSDICSTHEGMYTSGNTSYGFYQPNPLRLNKKVLGRTTIPKKGEVIGGLIGHFNTHYSTGNFYNPEVAEQKENDTKRLFEFTCRQYLEMYDQMYWNFSVLGIRNKDYEKELSLSSVPNPDAPEFAGNLIETTLPPDDDSWKNFIAEFNVKEPEKPHKKVLPEGRKNNRPLPSQLTIPFPN